MIPKTPASYRGAIRKIYRLYSIPQVLSKALRLTRQPGVSMESVGRLVSEDVALMADVVRLSNSAMYSRGEPCVDIQIALQRLGLEEIIRVIELSMSKHIFGKGLSHYNLTSEQYWHTSILGALLMEQLALRHGVDAPEAYTIGMLHALGRALINEVLDETGSAQPWNRTGSLENWEVTRVGFTQAEAGTLLLREWGFPRAIVHPIENQLGPTRLVAAHTPIGMLRLVRILLTLDAETGMGPRTEPVPPDLFGWAGFSSEEELMELVGEARNRLQEIRESLGQEDPVAAGVPEGL